jgi:hypothetical protein
VNRSSQTFLLFIIAVSLAIIAFRPMITPARVQADAGPADVFIEPGTTMLRAPDGSQQVNGKVVIDLRTGNIWGFPTLSSQPYPIDNMKTTPPVSRPFLLGKFDFSPMHR